MNDSFHKSWFIADYTRVGVIEVFRLLKGLLSIGIVGKLYGSVCLFNGMIPLLRWVPLPEQEEVC